MAESYEKSTLLIWGIHPIEEAIRKNPQKVLAVYCLPGFGKKKSQKTLIDLLGKNEITLERISDFHKFRLPHGAVHQGVLAKIEMWWQESLDILVEDAIKNSGGLILCDQIEDPQNLGAILRSGAAFGISGVIIPPKNNARINGTVVKASSGGIFHVKLCQDLNVYKAIKVMKDRGIRLIGLDAHASKRLYEARRNAPFCLVLGSESKGIRKNIKREMDELLKIPIKKVMDSLNVSCATCIALYEFLGKKC